MLTIIVAPFRLETNLDESIGRVVQWIRADCCCISPFGDNGELVEKVKNVLSDEIHPLF